ncbi:hypothetical protein [Microbulbifer sp. TRSA007]|uniref:hypothetical protein n=1 Tax=unclassified Microbulbifer TaxID=2619833 RepID=UPI0040390D0A
MDKKDIDRKDQLVREILADWGEALLEVGKDISVRDVLKQELRVATPTLRIFITVKTFEERAEYYRSHGNYEELKEKLAEAKNTLKKQIELGSIFMRNGFHYKIDGETIEMSSERLNNESLAGALNNVKAEMDSQTEDDLNSEFSSLLKGIEMFAEVYN